MLAVAAGGAAAAGLAAELGDGLFATDPDAELVAAYRDAGGDGPRYAEVPLAFADDPDAAAEHARRTFRFGLLGWAVMSELPNPVNFDAATAARPFLAAGFDHLVLINAGPDVDGFFRHFADTLGPRLREEVAPS